MHMEGWDLLYSESKVKIKNSLFGLHNPKPFKSKHNIMLLQDVTCAPNTLTFVKAIMDDTPQACQNHLPLVAKASSDFTHSHSLHSQIPSLFQPDDHGICNVPIFNDTDRTVTVKAMENYGKAYYADSGDGLSEKAIYQLQPPLPTKTHKQTSWSDDKKLKWIEEQYQLSKNPLLQDQGLLRRAQHLLLKYFDLFSLDGP